jgi:paraquat-inducible protein A
MQSRLHGYVACPDCDLIYPVQAMEAGQVARCQRCQMSLYQGGSMSFDAGLAWAVTALVLWIISNAFPVLELRMAGRESVVTFWQAVVSFAGEDRWWLAFLVLLTSMLVPLFRISSLLWILGLARFNRLRPGRCAVLLRWNLSAAPWGMLEIYLLAVLVAMVKLRDLATVIPGVAFYSFFGLIFVLAVLAVLTDFRQLWQRLEPGSS